MWQSVAHKINYLIFWRGLQFKDFFYCLVVYSKVCYDFPLRHRSTSKTHSGILLLLFWVASQPSVAFLVNYICRAGGSPRPDQTQARHSCRTLRLQALAGQLEAWPVVAVCVCARMLHVCVWLSVRVCFVVMQQRRDAGNAHPFLGPATKCKHFVLFYNKWAPIEVGKSSAAAWVSVSNVN